MKLFPGIIRIYTVNSLTAMIFLQLPIIYWQALLPQKEIVLLVVHEKHLLLNPISFLHSSILIPFSANDKTPDFIEMYKVSIFIYQFILKLKIKS